jgi:hypothetical protein
MANVASPNYNAIPYYLWQWFKFSLEGERTYMPLSLGGKLVDSHQKIDILCISRKPHWLLEVMGHIMPNLKGSCYE